MDDSRNGGIAGVGGGGISGIEVERDSFGREVAEIKGQRVLGGFVQELADRTSSVDRACETQFPNGKSSCFIVHYIDPLIHDIHNIHDNSIAEHVFHDNSVDEDRLHRKRIAESRIAEKSMPLIQVVSDEKFCVGNLGRHDNVGIMIIMMMAYR